MRNKEDFPHPLGPTTRTWSPRFMEKESALTRTLPPGVIIGLRLSVDYRRTKLKTYTLMNSISSLSMTVPLPFINSNCSPLASSETSVFSNRPAWISSITSNRVATRDVYPANSVTSLYENITRPKASELDKSNLRFVTKLSVRSPMVWAVAPGILKNTGTLQRTRPRAPQIYLMTKSSIIP